MASKELIYQVRKNLWSRGYKVQDMSDTELGFDLLVEGRHRVKVLTSFPSEFAKTYDFVAVIAKGTGAFLGKIVIRYRRERDVKYLDGPAEAFGLPTSKDNHGKKVEGKKEGSDKKGGAKASGAARE